MMTKSTLPIKLCVWPLVWNRIFAYGPYAYTYYIFFSSVMIYTIDPLLCVSFFSCVFIFLFTSIIGYPLYICWHGIHPSLQYTYFYQIELNFVNSSATSLLSYVVVTVEWVIILVFLFFFCRCSFSGFLFSLNPCRMYMYSLFICWHVNFGRMLIAFLFPMKFNKVMDIWQTTCKHTYTINLKRDWFSHFEVGHRNQGT